MSDVRLAADALGKALACVAEREYAELAGRLSLKQESERLASVFNAFREMAKCNGEPDFEDAWIALFYLIWYHPRQVNLFYSIFRSLLNHQVATDDSEPHGSMLQIVDFGCGALAAQMGLILACHDAFGDEGKPHIAVTNIDLSHSMTRLGRRLWDEWSRELDQAGLRNLEALCDAVPFKIANHRIAKVTNVNKDAARYLIASNVAFPSNLDTVHHDLARIWSDMSPDRAIVTTIGSRVDVEQLQCAFEGAEWDGRDVAPSAELDGSLQAITDWRRELGDRLAGHATDSIVENFLKGDVEWAWGPATRVGHFTP